jgi:hypothetical protein
MQKCDCASHFPHLECSFSFLKGDGIQYSLPFFSTLPATSQIFHNQAGCAIFESGFDFRLFSLDIRQSLSRPGQRLTIPRVAPRGGYGQRCGVSTCFAALSFSECTGMGDSLTAHHRRMERAWEDASAHARIPWHPGRTCACLLRSVRAVSRVTETPVHPQHASIVSCMLSTGHPLVSRRRRAPCDARLFFSQWLKRRPWEYGRVESTGHSERPGPLNDVLRELKDSPDIFGFQEILRLYKR